MLIARSPTLPAGGSALFVVAGALPLLQAPVSKAGGEIQPTVQVHGVTTTVTSQGVLPTSHALAQTADYLPAVRTHSRDMA